MEKDKYHFHLRLLFRLINHINNIILNHIIIFIHSFSISVLVNNNIQVKRFIKQLYDIYFQHQSNLI
jgi:hypothetical protein